MKTLKFKKFKGLHIVCKKCNKSIEINNAEYNGCNHPIEKQRYKAVIRIDGFRKTKDLASREYDDAVAELIAWKKELESPIKLTINEKEEKQGPELLEDCIYMFSDWLENVDVPKHEQKHRSNRYIRETTSYVLKFQKYLDSIGVNTSKLSVKSINKELFGNYYEYVEKNTISPASFNHHIRAIKSFFKFLVDEKQLLLVSPAKKAKLKYENPNPISIKDEDFKKLLSFVTENDSIEVSKTGKRRSRYKHWIKDSFELAAYTGMRLQEVAELKYSDIIIERTGDLEYLRGTDLKFNRTHNWGNTLAPKYVPIPITPELEDLLNRLNYQQHLDEDRYLLDGDCNMKRASLAKEMSHAFTFYRKKAGLPSNISIKHLRKTFLTKLQVQTGMVQFAGYQKTLSVIDKNYMDKRAITKEIKNRGFKIFVQQN